MKTLTNRWCGGIGAEIGKKLTDAAHVYGEQNLWYSRGKAVIE